jgi:hypothetical protein
VIAASACRRKASKFLAVRVIEEASTRRLASALASSRSTDKAMRFVVSAICFSAAWRSRRRTSNTAMTENTSTGSSTAMAKTPR